MKLNQWTDVPEDKAEEVRRARSEAGKKGAAARKTRGGRWTAYKGLEERPGHDRAIARDKSRLRAELAMARLEAYLDGKVSMEQGQIQAAKIIIDKGMPSLQAVEQTTIDGSDALSEQEIRQQLAEIIRQHPDLVQELLGKQARDASKPVALTPQAQEQTPDTV